MSSPPLNSKVTRSRGTISASPSRAPLRLAPEGGAAVASNLLAASPDPHNATLAGAALGATDPRWVLAVRVSEQLQGVILTPDRRERLVRTGKVMGLSPFDSQLIIAIVQDQARRGYEPGDCPTAGEPQLRMIPGPSRRARWLSRPRLMRAALAVAALLAVELTLAWWLVLR